MLAHLPPARQRPIGIVMTLIALATGAIWGQPMWGTWWEWDPRLTSFLILFLFYLGYVALVGSHRGPRHGGRSDLGPLPWSGSVFAILSRYAVNFWNQGLHQGASVMRAGAVIGTDTEEKVSNIYFYPLLLCIMSALYCFSCRTGVLSHRHRNSRAPDQGHCWRGKG